MSLRILLVSFAGVIACEKSQASDAAPSSTVASTTRLATIAPASASTVPPAPLKHLSDAETRALGLSADGVAAIDRIADTNVFGGWAVGAAGTPTATVKAWRTIVRENNAAMTLKLVLDKGSLAGQLMALAGLYDVDPAAFTAALPKYRGRSEKIGLMTSGCSGPIDATVAEIVERRDAVRLQGPKDDLAQWSKRNPGGKIEFDIVGGAYTAAMRERH